MIRRLLYLNGIAIIGVVIFHTTGMGFVAMVTWSHRYLPPGAPTQVGSLPYYGLRLAEQLVVACLPAFIFVSGFFVAIAKGRQQTTVGWRVVFGRIKGFVIPYLIWTALAIVLKIIEGEQLSISHLITGILVGKFNPVLYFVPLIVQLYLLAPFLVPLAQKHWKLLLLVSGIALLAVQGAYYPGLLNLGPAIIDIPPWFFLTRLFWFVLGMVVAFHLEDFKKFVFRWKQWLLLLTLVSIPIGILEWEWLAGLSPGTWLDHRETLTDTAYSLLILLTYLGFSQARFPFTNTINAIGASAFGIYLSHSFVVEYTARLIYRFFPEILGRQWVLQPLLIAFGLGIPLLMIEITRRTPLQVTYKYVFG